MRKWLNATPNSPYTSDSAMVNKTWRRFDEPLTLLTPMGFSHEYVNGRAVRGPSGDERRRRYLRSALATVAIIASSASIEKGLIRVRSDR